MRVRDCLAIGAPTIVDRLSREALLAKIAAEAVAADPRLSVADVTRALQNRELQGGTVLAPGIAVPHAILPEATRVQVLPILVRGGAVWGQQDSPITLVFGLIGPSSQPWNHVLLLARLARLLNDPKTIDSLHAATSSEDFEQRIRSEDERHD